MTTYHNQLTETFGRLSHHWDTRYPTIYLITDNLAQTHVK